MSILTLGRVGIAVVVVLVTVAVAAPWLAPYAPNVQVTAPFAGPSMHHWLGADDLGQDVFSQLLMGSRMSLSVGVFSALVATAIGTTVGLVAGVTRGAVDAVLMRVVDVMLTLPFVPLVIVLSAFAGPGFGSTIVVIGLLMWARTARVLRSQVLSVRERGPATVARAMGARKPHILWHHVLPSVFPLVVPELVRAVNAAILLESSLAFLGLGDPTRLSWGSMLYHANARSAFLTDAWLWWELPPGICIGGTVLAFVFVGYAVEERLRPRLATGWRPRNIGRARRAPGTSPARGARTAHPTALPAVSVSGVNPVPVKPGDSAVPVVQVESLSVTYMLTPRTRVGIGHEIPDTVVHAVHAVHDVGFTVQRGEIVGIVGESGSGKSTVTTSLLRLLPAHARMIAGRICIHGQDISGLSEDAMRRVRGVDVALIPQSAMNALNPVRTIGSQLEEAARTPSGARWQRTLELLELVGIPAHRVGAYPHELSGGMRQRVVIAMAMANTPSLIIADEPTSGLDVLLQAELLSVLERLRAEFRVAVLLVSHDLAAVARLADRVIVMQRGRVVEHGPTRRLLEHPQHAYTSRLVTAIPRLRAMPPPAAPPPELAQLAPVQRASAQLAPVQRASAQLAVTPPAVAQPVVVTQRQSTSAAAPLLELRRISKLYGDAQQSVCALDAVSLTLWPGERVGIIGASGAGKSTLARVVIGLTRADSGLLLLDGVDVTAPSAHQLRARARRVHMVFQDPFDSLAPGMRVADIVGEPAVIHGTARGGALATQVADALAAVGLSPVSRFLRAFPHELSGGERQRVALARALMLGPTLIVADEPTSQLDAPLRADMVALMHRLQVTHGTTYLYITHDIAIAGMFCDRLLIMHGGRIIESGPTSQVVHEPREPYTRVLLAAVP